MHNGIFYLKKLNGTVLIHFQLFTYLIYVVLENTISIVLSGVIFLDKRKASDEAWELFTRTGDVSHYLLTCALRENEVRKRKKD